MPELAEVEYFRKQWNPGINQKILRVHLHGAKRIFRGSDSSEISDGLTGAIFTGSARIGKQMLFRLSKATVGIHLGMTGELLVDVQTFQPEKHDHFVLYTREHALIFRDPRLFGRVRFELGTSDPDWWKAMPAELTDRSFTIKKLEEILQRRGKAPLKSLLLMQEFFPGLGNWMVDEVLWRAGLPPDLRAAKLKKSAVVILYREIRQVIKIALKTIGETYGDPPKGWLFHERWSSKGLCPKHKTLLCTATIGGRTTRWCPLCQNILSV